MQRMAVVGPGRVGTALARALRRAGFELGAVVGRRLDGAATAVRAAGAGMATTELGLALDADLVWLTLGDEAIARVAGELRGTLVGGARCPPRAAFVHTSGLATSRALAPLANAGARCASAHPLQAFAAAPGEIDPFAGTRWAIEGEATLATELDRVVVRLGGTASRIDAEAKATYHAGAALLSNGLVALASHARRVLVAAGIPPDDALAGLLALAQGTVANLRTRGLPHAITGPVSRGEDAAVRAHALALAERSPDSLAVYLELARELTDVARAADRIDDAAHRRLAALLEELRG